VKRHGEKKVTDTILKLERDLISDVEPTRWKAAADLGKLVESAPESLWPLVLRHGSSEDEDLRSAVATCILEHLLEYHFDKFFPKLEAEITEGNVNLRDTLAVCSKFGQAELPQNASKWDLLLKLKKSRS
jgi:hypothetical protein